MAQIRDVRKQAFYWIDNAFLDQYGAAVGPTGIAVYNALARRANNTTGEAWPGLADLIRLTGMTKTGVKSGLRKLTEQGLVTVKHRPSGTKWETNVYHLLPIGIQETEGRSSGNRGVGIQETEGRSSGNRGVGIQETEGRYLGDPEQHELTRQIQQNERTTPNNNTATALPAAAAYILKKYGIDQEKFNGDSVNIAAWLLYAQTQPNLKSPTGYAITMATKQHAEPEELYKEAASFNFSFPLEELPQALRDESLYRQGIQGGGDPYESTETLSNRALSLMMEVLK